MTGNDITTIIAAVLALVTAIVGLLNNRKINTVHNAVNDQHDDLSKQAITNTAELATAINGGIPPATPPVPEVIP